MITVDDLIKILDTEGNRYGGATGKPRMLNLSLNGNFAGSVESVKLDGYGDGLVTYVTMEITSSKFTTTNADRIRNMSDEELAEFLITFKNTFGEEYEGQGSCLDWLQSEEELGENMEDRYLSKAKRLDNGEWVVGFYAYIHKKHYIYTGQLIHSGLYDVAERFEVDPSTICQCAGLKDKNGELIWENDIVNHKTGKAVVVWDMAEWRIKWIKDTIWRKDLHFWTNEDDWKCEVIGNIFDNSELLESEE